MAAVLCSAFRVATVALIFVGIVVKVVAQDRSAEGVPNLLLKTNADDDGAVRPRSDVRPQTRSRGESVARGVVVSAVAVSRRSRVQECGV